MERKLDAVMEELAAVKGQLRTMEDREAEKGIKQTLTRAVNRLDQDCAAMKEKLFEIRETARGKAKEIVADVKMRGKEALNRVSEFLGVKDKLKKFKADVQASLAETDRTIAKIDTFGAGMREAGQKNANTFRTFADRPEADYSQKEKKFSKTALIKKPFEAKRKLFAGMAACADGAIEKSESSPGA